MLKASWRNAIRSSRWNSEARNWIAWPVIELLIAIGVFGVLIAVLGWVSRVTGETTDLLGFGRTMGSVGQVYPRSLDFSVVSMLLSLSSGPANLAKTIRLMAGADLVSEGFRKGQVGSSAMPHKMNSRSCERINGFSLIPYTGDHASLCIPRTKVIRR